MADITPAKAGDTLSERAKRRLADIYGKYFVEHDLDPEVREKTEGAGHWLCIDCGEVPQNNLMAWNHAARHSKRHPHRFAWRNTDKGGRLEEP